MRMIGYGILHMHELALYVWMTVFKRDIAIVSINKIPLHLTYARKVYQRKNRPKKKKECELELIYFDQEISKKIEKKKN